MNSKTIPKTIFTGGGSGGHLSIMKALIDYMRYEKYDIEGKLMIVGGKLGMISDPALSLDERRIPEFGVPYRFIRGGKLHRALKLATFKLVWGVIPGLWDSYKVIREFNPEVVFATGGYVSLPMIIVARLMGKKVFIHEQTLTAGLTNRIGAKFARKVLLTFKDSEKYFPKNKTVLTGNAIRKEIFDKTKDGVPKEILEVVECAKAEKRPVIYITGGSLGAHKINAFILENLEELLKKYTLIWQMGDNMYHNDFNKLIIKSEQLSIEEKMRLYYSKFIRNEIGYILGNSDLVVCRPGINTLYELAATRKKAIIIPLWVTSKNDQERNALWYSQNFTGKVLHEKDMSIGDFVRDIDELISKDYVGEDIDTSMVEERILDAIFN